MRRDDSQKRTMISIAVLIGVFYIFFSLNTGTEIMAVEYYNNDGDYIGEDVLKIPQSVKLSQSLFGRDGNEILFELQSTIPIEEDSGTIIVFRAEIENPFDKRTQLLHVIIYKNNKQTGDKSFLQKYMEPGEIFIFKSVPLDLKGVDAQRNIIKIVFTFETEDGDRKEVEYEYNYLSLTECVGDTQCSVPNSECDIHNKARFSTDPNLYFCVKPCNNNIDCPSDQLCIQGACGY